MKMIRSDCCEQPVSARGAPDFITDEKEVTFYYICIRCKEPCNPIEIEVGDWEKKSD